MQHWATSRGVACSLPTMGGRRNRNKQLDMGGQNKKSKLWHWCFFFGPPPVVDEEPLMSVDQFRELHRRRHKERRESSEHIVMLCLRTRAGPSQA